MEFSYELSRGRAAGRGGRVRPQTHAGKRGEREEEEMLQEGLDQELQEVEQLKLDISLSEAECRLLQESVKDIEEENRRLKKANDGVLREQSE